jgi:adenosylcobinamide kinase/adenosylcobinamide-phosphate guanylyltransferase
MRERVRRHRAERPETWTTVEPGPDVLQAIHTDGPRSDGIILDCLTLYVSRLLVSGYGELEVARQVEALCMEVIDVPRPSVIVTNEVGWGVVPETSLGRLFRDAAGRANQVVAGHAHEVVLLVCGLPMVIKGKSIPSPLGRGAG